MLKLHDGIVELFRKVATSIPPDVENRLKSARDAEPEGSAGREALDAIIENVKKARLFKRPVCQDTGVPVFRIRLPSGISRREIAEIVTEATRAATIRVPLRANAVDVLSDINSGDNTGTGYPVMYFEESAESSLVIDLMLKGAGCENAGMTYRLPDVELAAQRDLEGVRRVVLDTVVRAQGAGCPPYTLGVGLGATKDQVAVLSKKQLFRKLGDESTDAQLLALEKRLLNDINALGIGPIGLGGKTTALGVKICANHRHPASYFVDVSVACWANRRGTLIWS
jgi:fumarate hydratase class I